MAARWHLLQQWAQMPGVQGFREGRERVQCMRRQSPQVPLQQHGQLRRAAAARN
jgi:hypothetical protein